MVELTAVVLAGGHSTRMGTDKALLEIDGRPLVVRAVERIAPIAVRVLVASGDGRRLAHTGVDEIADAVADAGPLGGILAALQAARTQLVAVVAVDLPDADPALLERLAAGRVDEDVVVPRADGRRQPLHAIWAVDAAPAVRTELDAGRRSVLGLLDRLRTTTVDVTDGRFARNLNRPADLGTPTDPRDPGGT